MAADCDCLILAGKSLHHVAVSFGDSFTLRMLISASFSGRQQAAPRQCGLFTSWPLGLLVCHASAAAAAAAAAAAVEVTVACCV